MNAPFAKNHMADLLPAGLSYRSSAESDVRTGRDARRDDGAGRKIADAIAYLVAMPKRRAVLDELSRLSDRELADIGVARSELKRVFDPAFARNHARRGGEFGFVDFKL
jgi:uncharacterized protein YjiS (DUF1127 family)